MKVVLLLCFVAVITCDEDVTIDLFENMPPDQVQKIMDSRTECIEKTGVEEGTLKDAFRGQFDDENPALKAHILCFSQRIGMVDKNGIPEKDKLKEMLSTWRSDTIELDNLINTCTMDEGTPEERAFYAMKCLYGELLPSS